MEKVCPKCGALSGKKVFIDNFCAECYAKMVSIHTPEKVIINECKLCVKIQTPKWNEKTIKSIEKALLKEVKGAYENAFISEVKEGVYILTFLIKVGSSFVEVKRKVKLEFSMVLCPECSRKVGGYYEGIIQLRGERKKIEEFKEKFLSKVYKKTFVSKIIEQKNGVDIYIGSRSAVEEILSDFGKNVIKTNKLVGVKNGKRVFRRTFCIRL